MRSSTASSVPSARGFEVTATLVEAVTSASEALTTPRTLALSLSTSLRLAPSRDSTITVLPSTLSIVPRTRTFWACAAVANAATKPATASTRNFIFIWFPPYFLALPAHTVTRVCRKCDGPMTGSHRQPRPAPVIPRPTRRLDLVNKISLDQGAQGLRDLWPHAEPALEPAHRLMQQHPQPIDRSQPARPGGGKQRRLKRRVDQVAHHGPGWEPVGLYGQRRLAGHAE